MRIGNRRLETKKSYIKLNEKYSRMNIEKCKKIHRRRAHTVTKRVEVIKRMIAIQRRKIICKIY
jgi:hypothetical protein